MATAYWYAPAPVNGYPWATTGLSFYALDAIRRAFQWCVYPPIMTEEDLAWTGVFVVQQTAPPDVPEGMMAVDDLPEKIGNTWHQRWKLEPIPEPEPEPEDPPADPPVDEPETPAP